MRAYSIFGGVHYYYPDSPSVKVDANGVNADGYRERYAERHGESYEVTPVDEDQVRVCVEFLKQCERTKTGRMHSYGLKHMIEHWSERKGDIPYVSNGACIEAARRLGLVLLVQQEGPNAFLGVSQRSVLHTADSNRNRENRRMADSY